jgi:hypothetical protein
VPVFRDDEGWATLAEIIAPYYHEDVECRAVRSDDDDRPRWSLGNCWGSGAVH